MMTHKVITWHSWNISLQKNIQDLFIYIVLTKNLHSSSSLKWMNELDQKSRVWIRSEPEFYIFIEGFQMYFWSFAANRKHSMSSYSSPAGIQVSRRTNWFKETLLTSSTSSCMLTLLARQLQRRFYLKKSVNLRSLRSQQTSCTKTRRLWVVLNPSVSCLAECCDSLLLFTRHLLLSRLLPGGRSPSSHRPPGSSRERKIMASFSPRGLISASCFPPSSSPEQSPYYTAGL